MRVLYSESEVLLTAWSSFTKGFQSVRFKYTGGTLVIINYKPLLQKLVAFVRISVEFGLYRVGPFGQFEYKRLSCLSNLHCISFLENKLKLAFTLKSYLEVVDSRNFQFFCTGHTSSCPRRKMATVAQQARIINSLFRLKKVKRKLREIFIEFFSTTHLVTKYRT